MRSGDTTSTSTTAPLAERQRAALSRGLSLQAVGLGPHVVRATDVQERLLGDVVEIAVDDLLEGLDRLGPRREPAGQAGEDLGDEHRLRQEPLDLAGPVDGEAILFG